MAPDYLPVKKIIVHHTVTSNSDPDPAATVRSIYYYHAVSLGWGDIGYNFLIDPQGRIYEGRYGGNGVIGGHALTWNYGSVGIAALGDYSDSDITNAMYNSFVDLMTWKAIVNHINPMGNDYMNGAYAPNFLGHRDIGQTACPGDRLYARISGFRFAANMRYSQLPFYLIADASNPTGVYFIDGSIKRAVPPEVYNSWGLARYPIDYIDHQSFDNYATGSNLSKLVSANGGVYFVDRAGKRAIPDPNTFNIWGFDWDSVVEVSPAALACLPSSSNLSYLVEPEGSGSVYLVDNKTRHPLLSGDLLQPFGYPAQRDVTVISGDFPLSDAAPIASLTVKGSSSAKYVMGDGQKRLIPNDTILNLWNLGGASFTTLADSTITNLISGPDLSALGQTNGSGGVYLLEGGAKRPIVDYDTFTNWGFDAGAIFKVGSAVSDSFTNGAPLTRLMSYSGQTYLVDSGKKRQLANFGSLNAESLWHYGLLASDLQPALASTFNLLSVGGDPVSLISSNLVLRSGRAYYIDAGVKHVLRDQATFDNWGFDAADVITPFNDRGIDSYPEGGNLTMLGLNAGGVFLAQGGTLRPIFDANTFNIFKDNWGLGWGDITPISDSLRASVPAGGAITFPRLVTYSNRRSDLLHG